MSRSNLVYVAPQEEDYCLVVDYPAIGVHAVCQEDTLWKRPCIYCQICDPTDEGTEDMSVVCRDEAFEAFDQEDNAEEEVEEEEVEEEEEEEEEDSQEEDSQEDPQDEALLESDSPEEEEVPPPKKATKRQSMKKNPPAKKVSGALNGARLEPVCKSCVNRYGVC